ncbi:hypothetical protein [Streptomyces sp. NPDC056817]|uniref:hypothetical protein n=1 Tax=Streptomyces sp. NPDC056817 TaxID=3345950 RepID=UPI0036A604C6
MGYARYEITRNGETIEAGYGVETVCEEKGCKEKIDRGLDYLCGQTPGGDEYGCGGYYCGKHLHFSAGGGGSLCDGCCTAVEKSADAARAYLLGTLA